MKIDQVIQNYVLERRIGHGGMGEVWLARHQLLQRKVAIKCLHNHLFHNSAVRERFRNEAETLARLQHQNIVALHDYVEDGEGYYLILEYVEGSDLSEFINKETGPIPEPELSNLFSQILDGFSYAHRKRVIHRDIKPSNFLITRQKQIKILDFGIAKILDGNHSITKTGTKMGTVLYMSPEQVKGEVVDQRSDIYSLGITLFQMATGRVPYDPNTTEFQVYRQIVDERIVPISEYYPPSPPYLDRLLEKATAKDPNDRFQTVDEFKEALSTKGRSIDRPSAKGNSPQVENRNSTRNEPPRNVIPLEEPFRNESSMERSPRGQTVRDDTTLYEENAFEAAASMEVTRIEAPAANSPESPSEGKKRRPSRRILGGGIAFVLLFGFLFFLYMVNSGNEPMYVVASSLFVRASPDSKSENIGKIPYGESVEVEEVVNEDWIEIDYNDRPGFLLRRYMAKRKEFLELDHLGFNREARIEGMYDSFHKTALKEYFHKANYLIDLPDEDFEDKYGMEKKDSNVWGVMGLGADREYNSYIRFLRLEKGKAQGSKIKNSVFIIQNKAEPDNRRLVIFRHLKDGHSLDIGAMDITKYPNQFIRAVSFNDLDRYSAKDFTASRNLRRDMMGGKDAILLGSNDNSPTVTLITWKSVNQLGVYPLRRATYEYYGY